MFLTTLQPPLRRLILSLDENEHAYQLLNSLALALVLVLRSMHQNSGAHLARLEDHRLLTDQQNRRQKRPLLHPPDYGALMIDVASHASRYPFPPSYLRVLSRSINLVRHTICGIRASPSLVPLVGVCGGRRWMMRLRRFRRGSSGLDSSCRCCGGLVHSGVFVGQERYLAVIVRRQRCRLMTRFMNEVRLMCLSPE